MMGWSLIGLATGATLGALVYGHMGASYYLGWGSALALAVGLDCLGVSR